jgi:pimeloyl-ACP methyl ester carboxylesterase
VFHFLAPIALVVPTFLAFSVLPYGRHMVPIEFDAGLLFFFAVGAATELSVFMAGWSSRNKYALLGAMRAIAQMVSYEIPLILSSIAVIMTVGSLSLVEIVEKPFDTGEKVVVVEGPFRGFEAIFQRYLSSTERVAILLNAVEANGLRVVLPAAGWGEKEGTFINHAGLAQVIGKAVRPQEVTAPSLVVLPSRDRIVPPRSAEPLAATIPGASVLRPPFGHIGMMASLAAPRAVWQPISEWLRAQFA